LVHEPDVLFLDEPLTGTDPVARRDLMDIIQRLGSEGKSVLVSSHVLHEVQSLTPDIVLLSRGRLVAEGNVRQIRDLIDEHPHQIVLQADDHRRLAARLLAFDDVEGVRMLAGDGGVMIETRSPDDFYGRLPGLYLDEGLTIKSVYSDDDNLEAVFKYLVKT
jgi:ABC-2 type transport system ATP-binding protein